MDREGKKKLTDARWRILEEKERGGESSSHSGRRRCKNAGGIFISKERIVGGRKAS